MRLATAKAFRLNRIAVLTARHLARRCELTDAALLKVFFRIPLLTLRVVGGIHGEALKIWLKGIRLRLRPKPPERPISFVGTPSSDLGHIQKVSS